VNAGPFMGILWGFVAAAALPREGFAKLTASWNLLMIAD